MVGRPSPRSKSRSRSSDDHGLAATGFAIANPPFSLQSKQAEDRERLIAEAADGKHTAARAQPLGEPNQRADAGTVDHPQPRKFQLQLPRLLLEQLGENWFQIRDGCDVELAAYAQAQRPRARRFYRKPHRSERAPASWMPPSASGPGESGLEMNLPVGPAATKILAAPGAARLDLRDAGRHARC